MVSADTTEAAQRVVIDICRRMSVADKFKQVFDLYETGRVLVMAGLRQRHPRASDEQIHRLWARQHLGDGLFERVYGDRSS